MVDSVKEVTARRRRARQRRPPKPGTVEPALRRERWILLAVLLGALTLRSVALSWGVPGRERLFSLHPDEFFQLRAAEQVLLSGDWNPHFFNYGTGYIYLIVVLRHLLFPIDFGPLPAHLWLFYLLGRMVVVAMGVGTVWFTYLIGRELDRPATGLLAAAILAITPLHLVHSHYATVDVPATFFLAAALYGMVRVLYPAEMRWYLISGAMIGLAAATKYTLALALAPMFVAHFIARTPRSSRWPSIWHLLVAMAAAAVGFVAACPYSLAVISGDRGASIFGQEFTRDVLFEMAHMREGGTTAFVGMGSGWWYHLSHGLPAGLGFPLMVAAVGGVILALVAPTRSRAVLLTWLVVYFLVIGSAKEYFIRYLIPLTPVLAFFAADLLVYLWESNSQPRRRGINWLPAAVVAMVALPTLGYSAGQLRLMVRPDPRDQAANWIKHRLRPGDVVGYAEIPWFYSVPVLPVNGGARTQALFWRQAQRSPYRLVVTGWDVSQLARDNPRFFPISDLEYRDRLRLGDPDTIAFMNDLGAHYRKRVFEDYPFCSWVGGGKALAPPDWLYPWPRVEVYYR